MSQDKHQQQVIEKFSFIYTLTRSHSINKTTKKLEEKVSVDINEVSDSDNTKQGNEIIHSSSSSESVTLSSILGFPNIADTNGSGLCVLESPSSDYSLDFEELELSAPENQSNPFIIRHLGKIVFTLSFGYLIFVAWWLAGHSYYGQIFPFSVLRQLINGSEQQISADDLEFIDYMERSLANIERQEEAELSNSDTQQEDSQVVYVPVYNVTNPTANYPTLSPSIYNLPPLSDINNPPLPLIPPPPPVEIPTPTFSPPSASINTTTKTELSPSSSSSSQDTKITSNSVTSPVKNYTLIGIFELGERSAALFKADGVTKRIWVGDKVDNTGWILDSVTNQQAKITRQGEIRSLSVGEKF